MLLQNFQVGLVCVIAIFAHGMSQKRKYNMLVLTSPVGTKSHSIYLHAVAQEIVSRGHQVTFRSMNQFEPTPGITTHMFKSDQSEYICHQLYFSITSALRSILVYFEIFPKTLYDAVATTYKDPMIIELLTQNKTAHYDLAIVDALLSHMYLPLMSYLGIPIIQVSTLPMLVTFAWEFECPYYYYDMTLQHPYHIDNRPINFVTNFVHMMINPWSQVPATRRAIRYYAPKLKQFLSPEKTKSSMIISASSPISQNSIPSTPNVLHIGCAQCKPARTLPSDLESIVNSSSKHGVIIFSMGTGTKTSWLPEKHTNVLVKVLSGLKQTIIWNGELSGHPNASNFYIKSWIPQQDLLGHPNVRLIITHGGLGTIQEASYHGCPILGIPLALDHYYNIHHAHKNGYAEKLDWKNLNEKQLQDTINNMINNSRYKHMAELTNKRMRDVLTSPTEEATYWSEYVIRHKGANFLRHQGYNQNVFQYFLCDVIAVLTITFTLLFTVAWFTLKATFATVSKCARYIIVQI